MRRLFLATVVVVSVMGFSDWGRAQTLGGSSPDQARVRTPTRFMVSKPLRSLTPLGQQRENWLPTEFKVPEWVNQVPGSGRREEPGPHFLQDTQTSRAMVPTIANFEGVGEGLSGYNTNVMPPDTDGDVGPNYYVQWVNTDFAIFDKVTGNIEYGPAAGNTLWIVFGGPCENDNDGDPIVLYDQLAGRWVMTQFAVSSGNSECIAISQTSDPLGSFYLYEYQFSNFPDYPKVGVWPDAYYITYNMFNPNNSAWIGGEACAYDRAKMLVGDPSATQQCFGPYSSYGSLLPADLDGSTPPPAGAPNYTLAKEGVGASASNLLLWKFHVDWATPASSSFTGPVAVPVAPFTPACSGGACIPQGGTNVDLDSLASRLMFRLAYRNYGSHESLVVNHSVDVSGVSGIRWYELRDPAGSVSVHQSGTYSPDSTHRWMGSIAMDYVGNLAVGYSVSSSSMDPAIRYAGRLAGDPLGSLAQGEATIFNGTGSQTADRWGDYSSMTLDPEDDCTFWYTQEYLAGDGSYNWNTRIASFRFPGCTICPDDPPTGLSATANGDNRIDLAWTAVSGATEYRVFRSRTSGGPYTQIGVSPTTSYSDTTVSGNVTYFYVVRTFTDCESLPSEEAFAAATGICTVAPEFAGITSATDGAVNDPCTINLEWDPASPFCAGPVTYRVYRDTSSGFTPAAGNQIAGGVTCSGPPCTYSDVDTLVSGTPYFYIVRAFDASSAAEDTNTVEDSAKPFGSTPIAQQVYFDDFDGNGPPNAGDYWIEGNFVNATTPEQWHMPETFRASSAPNSYKWGGNGSADYDNGQDAALVLGGDGSGASGANGFYFDPTAQTIRMTFNHTYDAEAGWDGCYLIYSTSAWNSGFMAVPDSVSASSPYITSGGYTGTISGGSIEVWNGSHLSSWSPVEVNLDNLAGSTAWFVWRCYSDPFNTTGEGYYLDDVEITGVLPGGCTTGTPCTDPDAVSIDSITDNDPCAQDGVTITFSGGGGATSFDLYFDGGLAAGDITSPYSFNPGVGGSHSYVVQAVEGTCTTDSDPSLFTDADNTPAAPAAPTVGDDDLCVQDGVTISWGAVSGATGYEVRVDGTTTIYTGPATSVGYDPGDTASHTYDVRATNPTCGAGGWSGGTAATDDAGAPATPAPPAVTDISTCALSGLQISWGAVSGATSYDVQVDGTTTIYSGAATTTTHAPGDSSAHTYRVRAVNTCGTGIWSGGTGGADADHGFSWAGIDTAADRDACDDTGVAIRWSVPGQWNDAGGPGLRSYTVYREPAVVASGLVETTIGIDDIGGVNGTTYDYSVEAFNTYGCSAGRAATLPASDEVGGEPTFGGLQTVTPMPGEFCGLRLDWTAATSNCVNGPAIVYNVYRSTTPGFTPDGTTLEASCVADLFYEDHSVLPETDYYYVVRAEDSSLGHGGPCGNGFEDTNTTEVGGTLTGQNETRSQATDPLQVTSGSATSDFAPAFTITSAANASVSYTLSHGSGSGGTLSYDYGTGTIVRGATTTFSQTVVESETITSVDASISLIAPNPASSNLLIELLHVDSTTTVTVYDGPGNGFVNGSQGPYADFNGLDSASEWQLIVTSAGGSRDGTLSAWNLSIDYSGSGDPTACTQVELIDPSATPTVLKAYGVADANPYDVTALYTGAGTYQVRLSESCGSQAQVTAGAMSVDEPACVAPSASPVLYFTARSTGGNVKLEWENSTVGYGSTRICWDPSAFPVDPSTCTVLVDQNDGAGNYGTTTHGSLTNGQDYYYAAFVDNGFGEYSAAKTVAARPFDNSGHVKWSYHTAATALAPPGLYPGAAGSGASYGVSNDRVLHGMNSTINGGDWPRTAPFDWIPMAMNGPAQSRPPIVPTTVGAADLVAFLGSQDGHVYAVDAKTGTTLWQSAQNYGLVQGAPAGVFSDFGGDYHLLFAGSRVAGSGNSMHSIDPLNGAHLWSFGGTMGIISSGATVDYQSNRIYFASRENPSGSNHTLWCLSFTDTLGSLVWSQPYGDIDSAPVLFDGVLYVGTNAGVVMAVDPATGETIWSYATHDGPVKGYVDFEFNALPRKVFFATTGSVWALMDDGVSATLEWQQSTIPGPSIPLTLADEGALYVGSTDGKLYQLNAATGGVATSLQMGAGNATVGSPGYDWMNSLAYVGAEDGSVYAVTLPLQ